MSVVITVLGGGRPAYLEQTLASLESSIGDQLHRGNAVGVCFIHSGCLASLRSAESRTWMRTCLFAQERTSIAQGIQRLALAAAATDSRYWLHIEDDWSATPGDGSWLEGAQEILERHKNVGQVRLRHTSEFVSPTNLVTRKRIEWRPRPGALSAGRVRYRLADAHATFNPSLQRFYEARAWMCAGDEPQVMRAFHRSGLRSAQVLPGFFSHVGVRSLRKAEA